jgi:hypothetical protein
MPRKKPTEDERAEFMKAMDDMTKARLEMFADNAARYAEALGKFRAALEKAGFDKDEAMQIVLKVAEQPGRRPMFMGGYFGHWAKR